MSTVTKGKENLENFLLDCAVTDLVTMLLHQPGPQLKLPSWCNKSIYAISVWQKNLTFYCFGFF